MFSLKSKAPKKIEKDSEKNTSESEKIIINERPRICCVDLDKKSIDELKRYGFNIYAGSLGNKIRVPNNSKNSYHKLLLNFDFPENLHEYDVIILDLENCEIVEYKSENHIRTNHTGKSAVFLYSGYPETIFDPRPLSSMLLKDKLEKIGDRKHIIIVFTASNYDIEYETIKSTEGYDERGQGEKYNIYSFSESTPLSEEKRGKEMNICSEKKDFKELLEMHISTANYNQTFYHPQIWENEEQIPDPKFLPLIKNSSGDIVSIAESLKSSFVFYFPQIKEKGTFLKTFLAKIAPTILPDIFPTSETLVWKNNEEYRLPNHSNLLEERKNITDEYNQKIELKEREIIENSEKYSFLHQLITETGDKLVDAIVQYLKWLGFEKVKKVDENSESLLEEDIQVELNNGLLIIECKGIGGTSSDSDCSQISKIKHRRCKERNKFDVYALYIVNHQRYMPPINRQNPPFTKHQKQDAINDERGLLSTWRLFKLYFDIESGVIEKSNARDKLLEFGCIDFRPPNLIQIGETTELLKNGYVCIINLSGVEIKQNEEILIEKDGKFLKAKIVEMQLDNKVVESVKNGQIGIKLSHPVKKNSILWKK